MDAKKRERYEKIASELVRLAGGRDNILGIAHCATRLRLVLGDNDKADMKGIENGTGRRLSQVAREFVSPDTPVPE